MLLCELCVCLVLWRIGTTAAELINDNSQGNKFVQLSADAGLSNNVDNSLDYQDDDDIAGPNADYPTYRTIPRTSFSCRGRNRWGYYADVEAGCQVFHICQNQYSKISFLCPIGSVFNQRHLICDWWYNFDCELELQLLEEEARPNGYAEPSGAEDQAVIAASSDLSVSVVPPPSTTGNRKEKQQITSTRRASARGQHLQQTSRQKSQLEDIRIVPTANSNIDKSSTTKTPPREQRRNSKRINIDKIRTVDTSSTETTRSAGNKYKVGR